MLATTDLLLSHELRMRTTNRMRFELNVLNLFNQKTVRHRFNLLNRNRSAASINLANQDLSKPYDYRSMIEASTDGQKRDRIRTTFWHGRSVE